MSQWQFPTLTRVRADLHIYSLVCLITGGGVLFKVNNKWQFSVERWSSSHWQHNTTLRNTTKVATLFSLLNWNLLPTLVVVISQFLLLSWWFAIVSTTTVLLIQPSPVNSSSLHLYKTYFYCPLLILGLCINLF